MVGVVVLLGLAALGWMILRFGGNLASIFAAETIVVTFTTDRADGVADGSAVTYRGVESGHVRRVWLDDDRRRVRFTAVINAEPKLPRNLVGVIRTASLLGAGSSVSLETDGPPSDEHLEAGQEIPARFVGLGDFLPPQFGEMAGEMSGLIRQVRESNIVANLDQQVSRAGRLIDSLQEVVGDDAQRENIRTAIANMREVTEQAKTIATNLQKFSTDVQQVTAETNQTIGEARVQISRAGNNIESLSRQMGERLTQIAKLMDQFQSIAEKIDKGQGSAGQLVNDVRLYESLVDTSRELNETIKDFKRLVEQWEQEGVSLKLK